MGFSRRTSGSGVKRNSGSRYQLEDSGPQTPETTGLQSHVKFRVPGFIRSTPCSRSHKEHLGLPQSPGLWVPEITRRIPGSRNQSELRIYGVTRNCYGMQE
jgi:hypothetical protein